MSAKRFCALLLGLYALLLLGAAALVGWVDPYNLLNRNWTGLHAASERQAKPGLLRSEPSYRALLLGSSKTTYIDPGRLCLPGVFNASFPAAVPEEMLEFLQRFLLADRHRLVLVGLDPFMFNESTYPLRRESSFPETGPARVLGYLLGREPLEHAARTLFRHWRGDEPHLLPSGARAARSQLARHAAMPAAEHGPAVDRLMERHYGRFAFSTERLRHLRAMRDLLEARGVALRVFLNPLSEPVLARLRRDPAWDQLLRMRRELRAIFPDLVDLSASPYSAADNFFRYDPLHYLPEAGVRFMNEVVLRPLCGDGGPGPPGPPLTSAVRAWP